MPAQKLSIDEFLRLSESFPVFDVRSPKEYLHAHIPGAFSLPLFDDRERAVIGTTYKQKSREQAIKEGLDFFGPKMRKLLTSAEAQMSRTGKRKTLVHCWRGGMRSAAIAWLLDLYGYEVYTLEGGYKAFRNWVLERFSKSYSLKILSGHTGCGKTDILTEFERRGEFVLDLEGLANHRGSAFGGLGLDAQPSNEQFENRMAMTLHSFTELDENKPIWVESESSCIGSAAVNRHFFEQMKTAECIHLNMPAEVRLKNVLRQYGNFDKELLKASTLKIKKRLGGLETTRTLEFLEAGDFSKAFEILLAYYDKLYAKSTYFQNPFLEIDLDRNNVQENAEKILTTLQEKYV